MPHRDAEIARLRERVQKLERIIGITYSIRSRLRLTKQQDALVNLLVSVPMVTTDMVTELQLSDDVKMAMYRLRSHLANFGLPLLVRRGTGWYFDDETKAKILEMATPPSNDPLPAEPQTENV